MIADDEPDKLQSLRKDYNWTKYGVSLCGEACDGMDAYKLLVEKNPDICIMDVRMPVITGLEAMKRAKNEGVSTKFVVLSGYDEFSYAQQALSLSTVEYLLKPCRFSQILQAVLKCVNIIDGERENARLIQEYRRFTEGNLQGFKQLFLADLISGKITGEHEILEKTRQFQLDILTGSYAVCVIAFGPACSGAGKDEDVVIASMSDAVCRELSPVCGNEMLACNGQLVLAVSMEGIADRFASFTTALQRIADFAYLEFDLNCVVGISDIRKAATAFHGAYLEAALTTDTVLYALSQNVAFFAEMVRDDFIFPADAEKKVIAAFGTDENELMQMMDGFFSECQVKSINCKKHLQDMAVTLIYDLAQAGVEQNATPDGIYQGANSAAQAILKCKNLADIKSVLIRFVSLLEKPADKSSKSSIIRNAIGYIRKNYRRKISLESLSEHLHVSPSYFSMLFKQHTGYSLIEYLNRFRIEKAKALLNDPELKAYEIGNLVGFQDEKYFYLLFKRYTGLTATQFRDSRNLTAR